MDILSSVFVFCGTVSQTEAEYKVLANKLSYELEKAEHLSKTDKAKNVPKFMLKNLQNKINEAQTHLQKIQSLLSEDRIPFKEKLKLSLPFNKTNMLVKNAIQNLQRAQLDVNEYNGSMQQENNGKRSISQTREIQKKQERMISITNTEEVNDQDIEEALMGPTIEEDAAIGFTKNKYVQLDIEIHGDDKILQTIKQIDANFLHHRSKIQIKFQATEKKDIDQLELFSLGRVHFKRVYAKLKAVYNDIDRITKFNHFVVKLRRIRENAKGHTGKRQEEKQSGHQTKVAADQFFSFPCSGQQNIVMKERDVIIVQRPQDKNVYMSDETGAWKKMDEIEKQICKGEQIAAYIPLNKNPQIPDLYFKIHFEILE